MQAAFFAGSESTVKSLLENGAEVNASGGKYGSALQAAALCESSWQKGGYTSTVNLLSKNGAEVNAQGGNYGSAVQGGFKFRPQNNRTNAYKKWCRRKRSWREIWQRIAGGFERRLRVDDRIAVRA